MTMHLLDKNILVQLHNDPGVIGFILKLSAEDVVAFKQILSWPRSLLGMLSKTDCNVIEFLNKCNSDDKQLVGNMLQWPTSMFALLPKHNNKVLKFLNRISDTEKFSMLQFIEWPAALLSVLKETPHHIMVIYRMWDIVPDMPQFLKTYFSVYNHPSFNSNEMMDAFSNGQLNSKSWLIDTIKSLDLTLG